MELHDRCNQCTSCSPHRMLELSHSQSAAFAVRLCCMLLWQLAAARHAQHHSDHTGSEARLRQEALGHEPQRLAPELLHAAARGAQERSRSTGHASLTESDTCWSGTHSDQRHAGAPARTCRPTDVMVRQMCSSAATSSSVGVGKRSRQAAMVCCTAAPPVVRLQGRASQLQPEAAGLGACHAGCEGRAYRPSRQRLQGWPAPRKAAGSARETGNSEGAGAQKHRRAARPPAQQAHHQVLPGVADGLLDELQRRDPASHQEGPVSSSGTARLTAPGRGLVLLSMGGGAHSRLARHRRCLVYARQVLRPLYSSSAAGPHLASASLRQSRSSCEQAAAVDASCILTLGALLARLMRAKHMHGSTVLALAAHERERGPVGVARGTQIQPCARKTNQASCPIRLGRLCTCTRRAKRLHVHASASRSRTARPHAMPSTHSSGRSSSVPIALLAVSKDRGTYSSVTLIRTL